MDGWSIIARQGGRIHYIVVGRIVTMGPFNELNCCTLPKHMHRSNHLPGLIKSLSERRDKIPQVLDRDTSAFVNTQNQRPISNQKASSKISCTLYIVKHI